MQQQQHMRVFASLGLKVLERTLLRLIRRVIENVHVPLSSNWSNFNAFFLNKEDLAHFIFGS